VRNWTLMQWIVAIILIAAALGILFVVLPLLGFTVPGWVMQIFWICLVAAVALAALGFLVYLWRSWGSGPGP
jgi:NADH:ubiquinone oxidoreductase subunit K